MVPGPPLFPVWTLQDDNHGQLKEETLVVSVHILRDGRGSGTATISSIDEEWEKGRIIPEPNEGPRVGTDRYQTSVSSVCP